MASDVEWNMAVAYLQRLDVMMSASNSHSENMDCYSWFMILLPHYRELSPKIKKKIGSKRLTAHNKQINNIKNKINRINTVAMMLHSRPNYAGLYNDLHNWDMMLKEDMEKLNLITPPPRDPRWAMAQH